MKLKKYLEKKNVVAEHLHHGHKEQQKNGKVMEKMFILCLKNLQPNNNYDYNNSFYIIFSIIFNESYHTYISVIHWICLRLTLIRRSYLDCKGSKRCNNKKIRIIRNDMEKVFN